MIRFNLKFDDKFLVESFKRYRRQHPARNGLLVLRILLSFVFLILALASIYYEDYKLVFFFVFVIILILYGHKIDYLLIRYRGRKSPHINEFVEITLNENGFQAVSLQSETKAKWSIFTKAVAFRDGLLLFQGPIFFNWLPYDHISDGNIEYLIKLIKSNIKNYKVIDQPNSQELGG